MLRVITVLNLLFLVLIFASSFQARTTTTTTMATILGGVHDSHSSDQNSAEIDQLARFAVDDHNKKQNLLIEFVRVLKAREQVVAGTLHYLTIEAIDGGNKKIYEAKIWVKPWMNFKEVQEFNHAPQDSTTGATTPSFTSSDLGVKTDGHGPGLQVVAPHDPMVQDAADHAVKSIQQRSNSLFPYELSEILHAKAEVLEESAVMFDILLKVKRGDKEEKMKVKVHKNNEGAYVLNHMETAT